MIYGYARVSTAGQSKDGNSLDDQTKALQAYGCQEIITEAFSGKSMERPQFSMLFRNCKKVILWSSPNWIGSHVPQLTGFLLSESFLTGVCEYTF